MNKKLVKNETEESAREVLSYMREKLSYNPEDGAFRWITDINNKTRSGDIAGSVNDSGYRTICVNRSVRRAHRLAWLWMTGRWPENDIDHRNGERDDNRWTNLREATRTQNNANSKLRATNISGMKGVGYNKLRGTWHASIRKNGKTQYLGSYKSACDAKSAYDSASLEHFGTYARAA